MDTINEKSIERLCIYRRLLRKLIKEKVESFYSHELSKLAHISSVQIRRDLMHIGYSGSNRKGYETKKIYKNICSIIDSKKGMNVCIVGIGNLGKALVNFFVGTNDKLNITALFDVEKNIVDNKYNAIHCFHVDRLAEIIEEQNIKIGIISSSNESAIATAEIMKRGGVRSIINFTTTPLNLPDNVFLEEVDITTSIEKSAYFAKNMIEMEEKSGQEKRILVVDDDIDIVSIYKILLEKEGYKVFTASSSAEGLEKVKKDRPDLVILDIMMENSDSGFIFLNEMKEQNISVPVILSSSIAKATGNLLDVSQLNIKMIMQKPVDLDELLKFVKKYS
ncbi:MAG: redox-sensing transcriptional repressor Rex [Candidatus Delongbacteria bacterium]|jgi:redox-sensing transcriptional repressor|nr:redox-sensing transcriptional repressor Rex [Candidatus Delongbacteria bacterium]